MSSYQRVKRTRRVSPETTDYNMFVAMLPALLRLADIGVVIFSFFRRFFALLKSPQAARVPLLRVQRARLTSNGFCNIDDTKQQRMRG